MKDQTEDSDRDVASAGGGDSKRAGLGYADVPGTVSDRFQAEIRSQRKQMN